MKNVALLILAIATMVFASLYLRQSSNVIQTHSSLEELQRKVAELQSTVDDQEKKTVSLRAEIQQAQTNAAARDREIGQLRAGSANQQPAGTGVSHAQASAKPSNPLASLAKMFEDPEMKEAMAAQQKAALGPIIDKTYSKLFSDLRLTPEQTTALKEMLLNKQLAGAEIGMSVLSEGSDPSKALELGEKVKAATDAADAGIKAFLGEEKFAQLQAYEKTTADRMAISGFKDQLSGGAAITPEQEQQLVDAMTQARQNFKFTTDFMDKSKSPGDLTPVFNEENVNQFIQEMDQLNQHFLGHAQNILAPDQLESFRKYLNQQQALQKVGMQMGARMFAPAKEGQPTE
jgi:hypothetical protein